MSAPTINQAVAAASVQELRDDLRGTVIAPGEPEYDAARQPWNAMVDKHPMLIAHCADAGDVATAIAFARRHGLEIGVKGGGHSIVGQAVPDGGLMIDLSPMGSVRVDPEQRLAYVGGGALLGDLDRATEPYGLATTAGNVSHTGVGGLTLGGGMGWLARQLGLACDNVTAFEVVIADGSRLIASADENAELYWGLRGGGGNFGVVTQFTFRLHPIGGQVLSVDFFYRPEAGPAVLKALRDFARSAPPQANPTGWIGTAAEWPFLAPELHGASLVNAGYVWIGDPEEGRSLLRRFRDVAPPLAEVAKASTYVQLQASADEPMRPGMRRYWKDCYVREMTDEAIEAILARGGPAGDGEIQANGSLLGMGGAITQVGAGESAFSLRDAAFEFITSAGWEDPAEDEMRMAACRRYAAALEPFSSGTYVNALSDEGEAGVRRAYPPETLARLTALKDRYDPDNVFHLNHNIRPSRR
ncbi:MAG TPA: FAD-binding oxidoreductase [Candidatus Limnocylindria bacterium]|nr:FAD-binding oxidoreductase [Candidatus Limnocylindria bacterium]